MSLIVVELESRMPPNKITGANAGGRRQLSNVDAPGRPRRSILSLGVTDAMSKITKFAGLVSAGIVLGIIAVAILAVSYKFGIDRFVSSADAQMKALGGGLTNGRRSADGEMHAWSHDAGFDGAKLKKAVAILKAMDKDDRVTGLHIDLRDTGVSDADTVAIEGLSKLKSIDLSRTAVTHEGVVALLQKYPQIRINTNDFLRQTSK